MNNVFIPELNPISFIVDKETDYGDYVQKFTKSDITFIQVVSIGQEISIKMNLYRVSGRHVKEIIPDTNIVYGDKLYVFYTFPIMFSDSEEGGYYLNLKVGNDDDCVFSSRCIEVRDEHPNTFLIRYRNSYNAHDVYFDNNVTFSLRVEGGFLPNNFTPKSFDTVYRNQNASFELLKSSPFGTHRINIGGTRVRIHPESRG